MMIFELGFILAMLGLCVCALWPKPLKQVEPPESNAPLDAQFPNYLDHPPGPL